ncbi:hypothetical protein PIB30_037627 [Stylosanthes scabra]|uniref:GRF-type domain-containing protein n=1 Tax=Stylosanthes scabra TaxID=79078 RepID=A0ABU6QDI6_9FABA|nr:hypothetical protein [Stylosanthes scabra]
MSSSRCSSRSTPSTHRRTTIVCYHGDPAVLRFSGTKENPGRRFWGCSHYEVRTKRCRFFTWADAEQEEADPEKEKLRKKVLSLKSRMEATEWKMQVVVLVRMVGWVLFIYTWLVEPVRMRTHSAMPLKFG